MREPHPRFANHASACRPGGAGPSLLPAGVLLRVGATQDWKEEMTNLTPKERQEISTILRRRANEIAGFKMDLSKGKDLASVDYALELEINRLRHLSERVNPALPEEE